MKTNVLLFCLVVFVASGCATNKSSDIFVFDDTLAEENMTTIYWAGSGNFVRPASYNGITVDWEISEWGWNTIKIPGGMTTFELKGHTVGFVGSNTGPSDSAGKPKLMWAQNVKLPYDGKSITYNFDNGKVYTISFIADTITIHQGKSHGKETILEKFTFNFDGY